VARDKLIIWKIRHFLSDLDAKDGNLVSDEERYLYKFNEQLANPKCTLGKALMNAIPVALLREVTNTEFDCYKSNDTAEVNKTIERLKWLKTNN